MAHGLLAVLGVLAGVVGDVRDGGGELLHGAGLLGGALGQGLGAGGNLLGSGGNLLGALVDLNQGVAEAAVDGTHGGQDAAQCADVYILVLGAHVEVALAHFLQQAADVADALAQDLLTGAQGVAHLAQLVAALIVHIDVQLALAEAVQGAMYLTHGGHNAPNDAQGHAQHHGCGNNHDRHNDAQSDVGEGVLLLDNVLLRGPQGVGQGVARLSHLIEHRGTAGDDHLTGPVAVGTGHGDDFTGLLLPLLHKSREGVQLGLVVQGIHAGQPGQLLAQLADFALGGIQAAGIAGQHPVAQIAGGNVIIDAALGDQLVGSHIAVQNIRICALLRIHQNQRCDNDSDGN